MFNKLYGNIQSTNRFFIRLLLIKKSPIIEFGKPFSIVSAKLNGMSQSLRFYAFSKRRYLLVLLMTIVMCSGLNAQNIGGLRYFNLVLSDNSLVSYDLADSVDIQFQDSIIVVNGLNYPIGNSIKYYFSVNQYYSVIANSAEGGTVSGGGLYESGGQCTMTATAKPGYAFMNWTENDSTVSTNVSYTFTVTNNRNLTANFQMLQSQDYHIDNIVRINRTNCSSLTQLSVLVPFPLTNQYQTISDETYIGGQLLSIPNTPNKYVRFLYNSEQLSYFASIFDATVSFNAVLHPYVFDFSQINTIYPYDTSSPEYQQNTGASDVYIVPNHPTINSIAQNIWSASSDIVDYARRCYEYVAQNYSYLNPYTGLHPLAELLANGGGDCGNLSSIYISLLRNKSIPSRHVVTIRPDGSAHVWAEFYLENYGWIPVDVTYKQSNPNGNYFGVYDGNGIVVSKGICLTLERTPGDSYQCVLFQIYDWWFWHNNANLCSEITTQHIVNSGLQYSICVSANPSDGGCVTGEGVYNYSESCTVTATPAEGYVFTGWIENGEVVSGANPYTFSVTSDHNLVATFIQAIEIGESETTSNYLPSYSWYKYALSQQIYTADDIGTAGTITSIAFYNEGAERTRTYDFYLKTTEKSSFSSETDLVTVSESDKVFSGSVTMAANAWTYIAFNTPFEYNGTSNLVLVADDNSGRFDSSPYMACSVFSTSSPQAVYVYSDGTNFNPMSPPTSYGSGEYSAILSKKNHIILSITPYQTFTKEINAYTNDGGYYLLSFPTLEVSPEEVEHMFDNIYDLYAFDESQPQEWLNYKAENFSLEPGKGYLYANSQDVTLSLNSTLYNGSGEVTLFKTVEAANAGWNLVGNPFAVTAYLDRDFYVMNADGSEIIAAERDYIAPLEGVFVVAESNGEILTFSTTPSTKGQRLVLDLSKGTSISSATTVIDCAIVSFTDGSMLPKLQIKENSSKLFIRQDGKEYAVVNAGNVGEIPVSFKAESNGKYTISAHIQGVNFGYLHLIDTFTNSEIDLLSTSFYSFEASTSDNDERFKVVFAVDPGK